MIIRHVAPSRVVSNSPTYEPRPQTTAVDYAALGQLAIKRFPKVLAELAK
ncbi:MULTISPECIES: hypothetical protein [unclassified Rhizobium]|nr:MULTISPECIES: hypothetical protein [unclassified Rhizobium]MBD9449701.1 hypothetical protein [Rhizobium sp. RHZ01]NMN73508.1 hypothetical protein [Rhizobium sp. 57MFTsu3.2]